MSLNQALIKKILVADYDKSLTDLDQDSYKKYDFILFEKYYFKLNTNLKLINVLDLLFKI